MFRAFLITCIFLASSSVMAAEGSYSRSFYVKSDVKKVTKWIMDNEDAVVESTHCTIVSRDGDIVRVKKESPKGTFEFSTKVRISIGENEATYSTVFVKSHKGRLVDEQITVKITREKNRTKMSLSGKAEVDSRRIRRIDIVTALATSARGFERLITSKL
jgi:hypothetical protein